MLAYLGYLALTVFLFVLNVKYRRYVVLEQFEKSTDKGFYTYFVIEIKRGLFIGNEQNIAFSKAFPKERQQHIDKYGKWWLWHSVKVWRPDWVDSGLQISKIAEKVVGRWIRNVKFSEDGNEAMEAMIESCEESIRALPSVETAYRCIASQQLLSLKERNPTVREEK